MFYMDKKKKPTIDEIKKSLGLDKCSVIHPPVTIKKDGKHLYYVAGFSFPLRWETIERLQIAPQRILEEIDREEWNRPPST